jgi:hypothetical protein
VLAVHAMMSLQFDWYNSSLLRHHPSSIHNIHVSIKMLANIVFMLEGVEQDGLCANYRYALADDFAVLRLSMPPESS